MKLNCAFRKQCVVLVILCCLTLLLWLNLFPSDLASGPKRPLNLPMSDKHGADSVHNTETNAKSLPQGYDVKSLPQGYSDKVKFTNILNRTSIKPNIHIDEQILSIIREIQSKMVIVNASVKPFHISCVEKSIDGTEDLLCMEPPTFLQEFKNPCWRSKNRLECLPFFQVIGMDKCGSTDLFDRLAKHPDVLKNNGTLGKETMWWSWRRYGHWLKRREKKRTFQDYVDYFQIAANIIQGNPERNYITGDGTPMDLWDNSGWPSIPQNNGLKEPKYITPHLIKHVNPGAKFLVILRDPVERLFSDYVFLGLGHISPEGFHQAVVRSLQLLHACTRSASLRACLYHRNLHVRIMARIHVGFYVVFLQDWFQVFPREQFLILRTEDYAASTADDINKAFKFLQLDDLPDDVMKEIASSERKYTTKRKRNVGKMKAETRIILQELYGVFNQQLAILLNDRKFLWQK